MKTETGKLVVQSRRVMVELSTKKGTALFPIPESAKFFLELDAADGIAVNVEKDAANRIIKVTIPGIPPVPPRLAALTPRGSRAARGGVSRNFASLNLKRGIKDKSKVSPSMIGYPFHNPYTFISFGPPPERHDPTLLSQDEVADEVDDRISGVLQLKLTTISPLLTCHPVPVNENNEDELHKSYDVLSIGDDVIVPSTGVRGALRTLLTILTGGTLGYIDRNAFLIQGRDVNLGPRPANQPDRALPEKAWLGLVERPGSDTMSGTIRLGETRLVKLVDLQKHISRAQLNRSPMANEIWLQLDHGNVPIASSPSKTTECCWRLRLSGQPVGGSRTEERKREGVFKPGEHVIEIPPQLWADFAGRNAFGERKMLRRGDLVWLEPKRKRNSAGGFVEIRTGDDVQSLQWARWGRVGARLVDKVPQEHRPDSCNLDGKVDLVTDLFGQVPDCKADNSRVVGFAARVRPDNLVFSGAKPNCYQITLGPLAPPHPGCLAFYRDRYNPDEIAFEDSLRGFKVYRTTSQHGPDAPWLYANQGVYDKGNLRASQQKTNKTVKLLPAGSVGDLRISFRSLLRSELALLLQACHVPWRLGGGKPFGLGACRVEITRVLDEFGKEVALPDLLGDWKSLIGQQVTSRAKIWLATQQPVPFLRYPRAARGNSRGGHAWFQLFARPRMVSTGDDGRRESGISPVYITGELVRDAKVRGEQFDSEDAMIAGQLLPHFDPEDIMADVLYGYDVMPVQANGARNSIAKFDKPKET